MKKLTLILLLFASIVSIAQDEYYRTVDWKFYPEDIEIVGVDTYLFTASPIDFNDPGAIERTVGNYVVDFVGHRYIVIDSTSTTITVRDEYSTGNAPQTNQIARCYKSVGDGDAEYVGSVDYSPLDLSARWKINGADNELMYQAAIDSIRGTWTVDTLQIGGTGGSKLSWNTTDYTVNIPTGFGPVMQVGQELWVHVYNNSVDTMFDGKVVYPIGTATNNLPNIGLAIANSFETIQFQVGILTGDIPPNSDGFVALVGTVREIDITGLSFGAVYISPTIAGDLTTTEPEFPDYSILMGVVTKTGSSGSIVVDIRGSVENTVRNFWNGVFRESFDFRVISDGTTPKGYIKPSNGHPDMTMMFSDGFSTLVTTPADTINLIAGTDTTPQENYIYIPEATKVLTVSTSDYPAEEHIKVAHVSLASAATVVTEKGLMNQNVNDPVENTTTFQGHLSHITDKLRQGYADWKSGTEGSSTTGANIYFSSTGGVVYQMHRQTIGALTMPTDNVRIVNDFLHTYRRVTDLVTYQTDALGVSMNNTSFSIVYWIMGNKTGEPSHLMCNYPTGGYSKNFPDQAVRDSENYSVYDIPSAYKPVGFLVARCTYVISGGVWTLYETEDLRGKIPNATAGGGAGGGQGTTTYLGDSDTPNEFVALAFQKANSAATALENVLANAILLTEFDSTGFTLEQSQVVGLVDTVSSLRSDIIASEVDYGLSGELPFTNATGDGFDYDPLFYFNSGEFSSTFVKTSVLRNLDGEDIISLQSGSTDLAVMLTPLQLQSRTTDPLVSSSGQMWYNSTTNKFSGRDPSGNIQFATTDDITGGTVTSVSSSTTDQLTVANGTTTPALTIVTGAVADAGTALATGDQIHTFVTDSLATKLDLDGGNANQDIDIGAYSFTTAGLNSTEDVLISGSNRNIHIDGSDNVSLEIDRGATNFRSQIVHSNAGARTWYSGLVDGDLGVSSDYFIGQNSGGSSPSIKIDTNDKVTISGEVALSDHISIPAFDVLSFDGLLGTASSYLMTVNNTYISGTFGTFITALKTSSTRWISLGGMATGTYSPQVNLNTQTGNLLINSTTDNGAKLQVTGDATISTDLIVGKYFVSALNTAPSSATDTGTTGEIRITATYIYVCSATNTWVRTQLTTW